MASIQDYAQPITYECNYCGKPTKKYVDMYDQPYPPGMDCEHCDRGTLEYFGEGDLRQVIMDNLPESESESESESEDDLTPNQPQTFIDLTHDDDDDDTTQVKHDDKGKAPASTIKPQPFILRQRRRQHERALLHQLKKSEFMNLLNKDIISV